MSEEILERGYLKVCEDYSWQDDIMTITRSIVQKQNDAITEEVCSHFNLDFSELREWMRDKSVVERLRRDLKDCRNELCLRCGSYRNAHNGACDGCRWGNVYD